MEKEFELPITTTPKEDYTSMEKYVLSKLEIAEKTIQDLASDNMILKNKLATEKHKITVQEAKELRDDFNKYIREKQEAYYKEHNEYAPLGDMLDEFIVWLELGGFEIYVK